MLYDWGEGERDGCKVEGGDWEGRGGVGYFCGGGRCLSVMYYVGIIVGFSCFKRGSLAGYTR